jgi:thioredoxin-related protein
MKLLLILISAFTLCLAEVHWEEDYASAVVTAQKVQKPIYVFISAAECRWCAKFEKETLSDPTVIKLLNDNFVAVHLVRDFDTIPSRFKQRPVPRHYFLSAKQQNLSEDLGFVEADIFADELKTILRR